MLKIGLRTSLYGPLSFPAALKSPGVGAENTKHDLPYGVGLVGSVKSSVGERQELFSYRVGAAVESPVKYL